MDPMGYENTELFSLVFFVDVNGYNSITTWWLQSAAQVKDHFKFLSCGKLNDKPSHINQTTYQLIPIPMLASANKRPQCGHKENPPMQAIQWPLHFRASQFWYGQKWSKQTWLALREKVWHVWILGYVPTNSYFAINHELVSHHQKFWWKLIKHI